MMLLRARDNDIQSFAYNIIIFINNIKLIIFNIRDLANIQKFAGGETSFV